jgi:hypothetical protein
MPIARPVARSAAIRAHGIAIESETFAERIKSVFSRIVAYHFVENPPHTVASSDLLKEKTRTVRSGK